jgi:hypothetical protein
MPKYEGDEDDDAPPGWIGEDFAIVEQFETYKQTRAYKYGKRKAPCSCRYFKGVIPPSHICYKPVSKYRQLVRWVKQIVFPNRFIVSSRY